MYKEIFDYVIYFLSLQWSLELNNKLPVADKYDFQQIK